MGRMLAAIGDLNLKKLRNSFALMAGNVNDDYEHERRADGPDFAHEDGWGVAWAKGRSLLVRHSIHSCLVDPQFEELEELTTDMVIMHARRSPDAGPPRLEDTHPFLVEHAGTSWSFCHSGNLHNLRSLRSLIDRFPEGKKDSERLFHHLLRNLDGADVEGSIIESLEPLEDYTALHCILAAPEQVIAVAKRHPEKSAPSYDALWQGQGPNLRVVSSEPLEGIGCTAWERIPEPGVVTLKREGLFLRS